jgi:hypothetical protein
VYAVRQADEALSLLVGEPAGAPDEDGQFPEGSVNARVVERLRDIAEILSDEELKELGKEPAQLQPELKALAKKSD